MTTYYIMEKVADINGHEVNCVAGLVLEDLHGYSDERALVEIGNQFWAYTGNSIKLVQSNDLHLYKSWKHLSYTAQGEFIK